MYYPTAACFYSRSVRRKVDCHAVDSKGLEILKIVIMFMRKCKCFSCFVFYGEN